jgi:hypothetical protein
MRWLHNDDGVSETMTERYLPKWAKEQIADLERENKRLHGENTFLKAAIEGTKGSDAFEVYRSLAVTPLLLPEDTDHISVKSGPHLELFVRPNRGNSNGGVGTPGTIEVRNQCAGGLYVIHQSGNTMHIGSTHDIR